MAGAIFLFTGAKERDLEQKTAKQAQRELIFSRKAANRDADSLSMITHGVWGCQNADCQYLEMTGGQAFRSAAAQGCSICREDLVRLSPESSILAF